IRIGTHFKPLWYSTKKLALKVTIIAATEMKSATRAIISLEEGAKAEKERAIYDKELKEFLKAE
nr:hypothetical protein [Tanacetum cinerariifolium]